VAAVTHVVVRLPANRLSERELEILSLVAGGLDSKEIARELFLSHETVRTHMAHALAKLGARSRAQAVAVAIRNGLID
jgi:DNA-binding NarL/FixJ family response regulator